MELSLPASILTPFPQQKRAEANQLLREALAANTDKIVVLDDDPTGVQTVHGVNVYTDWSLESMQSGFAEENRLFFVLTNSRGFTAAQTTLAHREIVANLVAAAKQARRGCLVISRGDSTLRGHYPLETEVLCAGLTQGFATPLDAEILCPYFAQGGRFTIRDVHYVRMGDRLIPAAQTEFAQDKTFGYKHSNLRAYIAEKTNGAYKAEAVTSIAMEDLRVLDVDKIAAQLMAVQNFGKVIVNAMDDDDLTVFFVAMYRAMAQGKHFCLRTAASAVRVAGGISERPLLRRAEMIPHGTETGGIVVVGSHTQKTTAQLQALLALDKVQGLELNSDLVLEPGALEMETARVATECDALLCAGKTPIIYTKRALLSLPGDTPEAALARSVEISQAVQSVVSGLRTTPAFVVAKGGITSSDVGTKALRVQRALVLGQIQPGVPVWRTGPESRFPGVPYVIFPGNVGEENTLRAAVEILSFSE